MNHRHHRRRQWNDGDERGVQQQQQRRHQQQQQQQKIVVRPTTNGRTDGRVGGPCGWHNCWRRCLPFARPAIARCVIREGGRGTGKEGKGEIKPIGGDYEGTDRRNLWFLSCFSFFVIFWYCFFFLINQSY